MPGVRKGKSGLWAVRTQVCGLRHTGMLGEQGVLRLEPKGREGRGKHQKWFDTETLARLEGPDTKPLRKDHTPHQRQAWALRTEEADLTSGCGWTSHLHALSLRIIRINNQNKAWLAGYFED